MGLGRDSTGKTCDLGVEGATPPPSAGAQHRTHLASIPWQRSKRWESTRSTLLPSLPDQLCLILPFERRNGLRGPWFPGEMVLLRKKWTEVFSTQDNNLGLKSVSTNSANAVHTAARRATVASAKLERRQLPADYVRTAKVTQFLNERRRPS